MIPFKGPATAAPRMPSRGLRSTRAGRLNVELCLNVQREGVVVSPRVTLLPVE